MGHSTEAHVILEYITATERQGNRAADSLACRGRDARIVPSITLAGHSTRKLITVIVQRLAIDTIIDRQLHRQELEDEEVAHYCLP